MTRIVTRKRVDGGGGGGRGRGQHAQRPMNEESGQSCDRLTCVRREYNNKDKQHSARVSILLLNNLALTRATTRLSCLTVAFSML